MPKRYCVRLGRGIPSPAGKEWVSFVLGTARVDKEALMEFLLWLLAVILVIAGIVYLVRGAVLYGLVLVIVGFLVGPGGVSVFT